MMIITIITATVIIAAVIIVIAIEFTLEKACL